MVHLKDPLHCPIQVLKKALKTSSSISSRGCHVLQAETGQNAGYVLLPCISLPPCCPTPLLQSTEQLKASKHSRQRMRAQTSCGLTRSQAVQASPKDVAGQKVCFNVKTKHEAWKLHLVHTMQHSTHQRLPGKSSEVLQVHCLLARFHGLEGYC